MKQRTYGMFYFLTRTRNLCANFILQSGQLKDQFCLQVFCHLMSKQRKETKFGNALQSMCTKMCILLLNYSFFGSELTCTLVVVGVETHVLELHSKLNRGSVVFFPLDG